MVERLRSNPGQWLHVMLLADHPHDLPRLREVTGQLEQALPGGEVRTEPGPLLPHPNPDVRIGSLRVLARYTPPAGADECDVPFVVGG